MIIFDVRKATKFLIKLIYHAISKWNVLQFYPSCNISIRSKFEGANKIYPNTEFSGTMGYGSYIQRDCRIEAHIGRFTSIAPFVKINHGRHPFTIPFATCSPMFYSVLKQNGRTFTDQKLYDEEAGFCVIGNDCWIGENVFIVGGTTIGDGAVILAGAVVTKDVPPYAVMGGVPAKVLKYRFDEDTIKFLLVFRWWSRDIKWIEQHGNLLCDIEKLKQYAEKESYQKSKSTK